uniref:NAD(P)-binding domain-containing protein n=1 Tax=Methylobacterium radiotolerans TaxID=31998 RepID=UPI002F35A137
MIQDPAPPGPEAAFPTPLVLAGAGKMGSALLRGWLAGGLDPVAVSIVDPHPSPEIVALCAERGLRLNPGTAGPAGALVLGIKPQALDEAAAALGAWIGPDTLVVSILAGKTIADLKRRLPGARAVVRAMPNLPASIGRGATGAVGSPEVGASASYNPVLDKRGRVIRIVKFATDITLQQQRSMEAAAQIAAIDRSQAIIRFTLDGTITAANPNFLATMGSAWKSPSSIRATPERNQPQPHASTASNWRS